MADNIKLVIALVITASAIALFYTYAEYSALLRVLGLLVAVSASLLIAATTQVGSAMLGYISETQVEVRKVVWPTRQETVQTTMIVILMVMVAALMLWAIDSVFGWVVRALTV